MPSTDFPTSKHTAGHVLAPAPGYLPLLAHQGNDSGGSQQTFATIVADPPWALEWNARVGNGRSGQKGLPYPTMTIEEICALPVEHMAKRDAHLWLWTTWNFLWCAPRVILSWGFQPSYMLTWAKPGIGVGGRFRHSAEYCIFCERGKQLPITRRDLGTWYSWPRGEHSKKPDAFYDLVESVSPSPRVEMFAREQRLGWSTWGNECFKHVSLQTGAVAPAPEEGDNDKLTDCGRERASQPE